MDQARRSLPTGRRGVNPAWIFPALVPPREQIKRSARRFLLEFDRRVPTNISPRGEARHTTSISKPYRTSRTMEIIMAVIRSDDYPPYGMMCPRCNDLIIAPSQSAYVSESNSLHLWNCETCGHNAEIFDRLVQMGGAESSL